jgi:hypothetical protein
MEWWSDGVMEWWSGGVMAVGSVRLSGCLPETELLAPDSY